MINLLVVSLVTKLRNILNSSICTNSRYLMRLDIFVLSNTGNIIANIDGYKEMRW